MPFIILRYLATLLTLVCAEIVPAWDSNRPLDLAGAPEGQHRLYSEGCRLNALSAPPGGGIMVDMSADVAAYWDGQAETFDAEPDHGLSDPVVRNAWTRLLLPLMPTTHARVADVGSGTGSLAVLLAQAGHRVSGVDLAPRMVEVARAKAAVAGVPAEFEVGNASAPPWPARTFDVVLVRHVLWALPDPEAAMESWVELLKPDGRLVLVEGRWWTGGGLAADEATELVLRRRREAAVTRLDDPNLWGGPIRDERYMLVSRF